MPPQAVCSSAVTKYGASFGVRTSVAPVAELETGDQVGLNGAACAACTGRDAEIMINDSSDGPKADTAALKESQNIRRLIDKGDHALLVEFTAPEEASCRRQCPRADRFHPRRA